MKRDIETYRISKFTDYKGDSHSVVICAISQTPETISSNLIVGWTDDGCEFDYNRDPYCDIVRTVSVGISICHPADKFDEEIGKRIARNKALEAIPVLYATEKGIINRLLVEGLIQQELEFLKRNPGKYIKGYDEAQEKYKTANKLKKELDNLSNDEASVIEAILNGINLDKCIQLAKKLRK